jgi:maleylacetoacetate isomerase
VAHLTLYSYWRSSASHRARIALEWKGLSYDYVPVSLARGEQTGDAHRARSPTGYVPCLAFDGVPYVESVAIVELLEELHPEPPLYPRDPFARARVRALVEIVNSGIQPLQNTSTTEHVGQVTGDGSAVARWLEHFVGRGLGSLERALERTAAEGRPPGPHAFGASITAADVFLVPQGVTAGRIGLSLDPFPRVARAFEAAMKLEAFQRAAPERQVDFTAEPPAPAR